MVSINKYIKKRMLLFCVTLFLIAVFTIGTSYALLNNKNVNKSGVFNNEILEVTYENGHNLVTNSSYPMSFQQGISSAHINKIKIVNKAVFSALFFIKVSSSVEQNSIGIDKIYYQVNNEVPVLLSNASEGIIYKGRINFKEEVNVEVKFWIAQELISNNDQGKNQELIFEVFNK